MMTKILGGVALVGWLCGTANLQAQFGFDDGGGSKDGRLEGRTIERPALFNPQIEQLYRQAVQLLRSRRYDEAEALCQQILTIKTNELNTVTLLREISEMRARVPAYDPGAALKRRLQQTRIRNFKALEVRVPDLIAPLQEISAQSTPDGVPLNLIWHTAGLEKIPIVTFDLNNVTMTEVLHYLTFRNGLSYRVDENAVVIGKDLLPGAIQDGRSSPLQRKLRETVLPEIKVREAKLQDAVSLVQDLAAKHSADRSALNVVWQVPADLVLPQVSLSLYRISLADALRYVTEVAGLRYQVDERAIVLYPATPVTAAASTVPK